MTWRLTAIAALVLLAAVACSRREEGAMGEPKQGDERGFVESTASGGMLEVKLGEYAAAHAEQRAGPRLRADDGRGPRPGQPDARDRSRGAAAEAPPTLGSRTPRGHVQGADPAVGTGVRSRLCPGDGRRPTSRAPGAARRDRARARDAGRSVGLGHPAHGASAPRARPRARGPGRPGGAAVPASQSSPRYASRCHDGGPWPPPISPRSTARAGCTRSAARRPGCARPDRDRGRPGVRVRDQTAAGTSTRWPGSGA